MQYLDDRPTDRASLLQLGVVVFALLLAHAAPKSGAPMLLVPLTPSARASAMHLAIDGGAKLVALGPIVGSIVIRGERPGLRLRMLMAGVLPLATDVKGCGGAGAREA